MEMKNDDEEEDDDDVFFFFGEWIAEASWMFESSTHLRLW